MKFNISHKIVNRVVFVVLAILGSIYYFNSNINSPEECQKIAGKWNAKEQTCEQTIEQLIYENLAGGHPLTVTYPAGDHQVELNKTETIAGVHYLIGHYQIVLKEAQGDEKPVYDRGSIYVNMSKMRLITENKNQDIYFVAPFVMQTAGSGVFVYMGLFSYDIESQKSAHLDSFLLGDRIRDETIYFTKDYIQVDYKDYADNQSFSDFPSELKSISLLIQNLNASSKTPKFKAVKRMHHSWDMDADGLNDCEKEGVCDHSVDYSKARVK